MISMLELPKYFQYQEWLYRSNPTYLTLLINYVN